MAYRVELAPGALLAFERLDAVAKQQVADLLAALEHRTPEGRVLLPGPPPVVRVVEGRLRFLVEVHDKVLRVMDLGSRKRVKDRGGA